VATQSSAAPITISTAERQLIDSAFDKVFEVVNEVVKQCDLFGFAGMSILPKPTLKDRVFQLKAFRGMLNALDDAEQFGYDASRRCANATQWIWLIEMLSRAVDTGNRDAYDDILAKMRNPTPI